MKRGPNNLAARRRLCPSPKSRRFLNAEKKELARYNPSQTDPRSRLFSVTNHDVSSLDVTSPGPFSLPPPSHLTPAFTPIERVEKLDTSELFLTLRKSELPERWESILSGLSEPLDCAGSDVKVGLSSATFCRSVLKDLTELVEKRNSSAFLEGISVISERFFRGELAKTPLTRPNSCYYHW
jgi:hypothetical protein